LPTGLVNTGYSLEAWYMDSAYSIPYDLTTMPSEPVTIYVKWTVNQYTISFEENGGEAVSDKTQNYGTTVTSPTPVRTGYSFVGWFKDVSLTEEYRFAVMEAENITLYAKWEINTYNIQYYDVQADYEILQIATGDSFTLALTTEGQLLTWGYNASGQLGDGTTTGRNYPVDILKNFNLYQDEVIIHVNVGYTHSLAVTSLGRIFTWGSNNNGQLGTGNMINQLYPYEITSNFDLIGEEKIVKAFGGDYVSYAISSTGRLFAWGSNSDYKIGDGTAVNRLLPKDITPYFNLETGETITQMHPGNRSALAVTSDGRIFTWGYDGGYGVLARGDVYVSSVPYDVTANFNFGVGETIIELSFGKYGGAIITSAGRVITWGYNDYYELATGNNTRQWYPIDVTANFGFAVGENPVQVTMGYSNLMLVTSLDRILVIGRNSFGSLATGNTTAVTVITDVTGNFSFDVGDSLGDIMSSRYNSFGFVITTNGKLIAWGGNFYGQLGDSTNVDKSIPFQLTLTGWNYYNSSNFEYQATIVLISDPVREGYTFDGWFTEPELINPFVLTEMPASDIILYASWTEMPI
jgi:uncharacterized repeat protein (TIGR02543 family)